MQWSAKIQVSGVHPRTLKEMRHSYRLASLFALGGLAVGFRYWLFAPHWTALRGMLFGYVAICFIVLLVDIAYRINAINRELADR